MSKNLPYILKSYFVHTMRYLSGVMESKFQDLTPTDRYLMRLIKEQVIWPDDTLIELPADVAIIVKQIRDL